MNLPKPKGDVQEYPSRFPRFKLRIHRASNFSAGTGRLSKRRGSSEGTSSKRSSRLLSGQAPTLNPRPKPRFSNSPGEVNSSHIFSRAPLQTLFVESFDLPSQANAAISSPAIMLSPPSPGTRFEAFSPMKALRIDRKSLFEKGFQALSSSWFTDQLSRGCSKIRPGSFEVCTCKAPYQWTLKQKESPHCPFNSQKQKTCPCVSDCAILVVQERG